MDLTKQLQAYEVEYQVLNDELHAPSDQRSVHLEKVYQSLQQQNSELLEELQVKKTHTKTQEHSNWLRLHSVQLNFILCSGVPCSCLQPGATTREFGPV